MATLPQESPPGRRDQLEPTVGPNPLTSAGAEAILARHPLGDVPPELQPDPLVSVCLITFNQVAFIREALDSVLAQSTRFPIEIVVGDDRSTDGTTSIALGYQRRHPDRVRVLVPGENLGAYTRNGRLNFVRTLRACRGRYIALLEGDDFWTEPSKLQRQVDLLECEPALAGTFHETEMTEADGTTLRHVIPGHELQEVSAADIISPELCFHTSSFVFRAAARPDSFPDWFYRSYGADLPFFVLIARTGAIKRLSGSLSRWRRHPGGWTAGAVTKGVRVHLARIELWQSMRSDLPEHLQAAVDSTCAWHRARIIELFDRLQEENRRLGRPLATARHLLAGRFAGILSRLREGVRHSRASRDPDRPRRSST